MRNLRFQQVTLLWVLCLLLMFVTSGCRLFSWFSKKDVPTQNNPAIEKMDKEIPQPQNDGNEENRVAITEPDKPKTGETDLTDQGMIENRPQDLPQGPGESRNKKSAGSESASKAKSLSAKIKAQNISNAEDRLFQMERIGNDLGLNFLDRLESNVGRLTFKEIVDLWGPPQDLQDQDFIVSAVWRWRTSKVEDHGEMITLLFDRGRGLLLGWQYGKW